MLAVDVDGVISLFGFEEPPDRAIARFELIDGMVHCISVAAGERLRRLSEHYDLVWATGWEDRANDLLPQLLGLPELPSLTFDGAARFGIRPLEARLPSTSTRGAAPLAWIDDSFDESCYEWARAAARRRPDPARPDRLRISASRRCRPRRWSPGPASSGVSA